MGEAGDLVPAFVSLVGVEPTHFPAACSLPDAARAAVRELVARWWSKGE